MSGYLEFEDDADDIEDKPFVTNRERVLIEVLEGDMMNSGWERYWGHYVWDGLQYAICILIPALLMLSLFVHIHNVFIFDIDGSWDPKPWDAQRLYSWRVKSIFGENVMIDFDQLNNEYRVSITVATVNCSKASDYFRLASDRELLYQERIGPDEIVVQIEGKSLQSLVARSDNFCSKYSVVFSVPLSGSHRLKVTRLRRNYEAVRMDNPSYPPMNLDVFLDVLLPISLEEYEFPICSLDSAHGHWVTPWDQLSHVPLLVNRECMGELTSNAGFSEPLTTYIIVDETLAPSTLSLTRQNCSYSINKYHWKQSGCYDLNQTVIDVSSVNITDHTSQNNDFVNKRILFVGDSHMRGLADLFMHVVCEYELERQFIIDPTVLSVPQVFRLESHQLVSRYCAYNETAMLADPACYIHYHYGCQNTTLAFLGSMYCSVDMLKYFADYDFIIINCGHHPASQSHFSYELYEKAVNNLLNHLEAINCTSRLKLFWVENTAQPLRQDHWVVEKQDWRTYHRLVLFDALAKRALHEHQSLNVRIVPAWDSTLALFDKFCDCAHYPAAARIPELASLLGFMHA